MNNTNGEDVLDLDKDPVYSKLHLAAVVVDEVFNGKDEQKPSKFGFVLMVFEFGDVDNCKIITNGPDREAIEALMRSMLNRFNADIDNTQGNA